MSIRFTIPEFDALRAVVQAGVDGVPVRRAERIEQAVMSATEDGETMVLDLDEDAMQEIRDAFLAGEPAFVDAETLEAVAERLDVSLPRIGMSP